MKKNRRLLLFLLAMFSLGQNIANAQLVCNNSLLTALPASTGSESSTIDIWPEDILENEDGVEDLQISLDNVSYSDFITFDCDDIGTHVVYVEGTYQGVISYCWGNITVEDTIKPVPYAQNITVSMNGGSSVTINTSSVDAGSFDNCSIESMSLSQYTFTANGNYNVDFTITDASGNSDYATVLVTVIDGAPTCNEDVTVSLSFNGQSVVDGAVFVEGNIDYDLVEVSLDNVNFEESVLFTCDDAGLTRTVYVRIVDDGEEYNCSSQVLVEDKLAPSVIVGDFTIDLASASDTYTLLVSDIELDVFENCPGFTSELSQTNFSSDNWGNTPVVLTVTDASGNTVSATSTVTVLINGETAPLVCLSELTVLASPWGGPELWGVDFVVNSGDYDQVLASLDPLGPFTESFIAPCGVNGEESLTVYLQALNGIQQNVCSSVLTVIDNIPPVVAVDQSIFLSLVNGTATLTPEMVDDGSYDSCTDIILSIDQTVFTTADIGTNTVTFTAEDLNGNTNSTWTNVIVEDGNSCSLEFVVFPFNIDVFDENGTAESLSIQNLQDLYGYTFEEVHPFTNAECDGIAYTYNDQVISISFGFKVIRTWTAIDWYTASIKTKVQTLNLYNEYNGNLACNSEISVAVLNGPVTLYPSDVLEGGPYNYEVMELSLEDSDGNIVDDNLITSDYIGQTLTYQVTNTTNASSCWGFVLVEGTIAECELDGNDVNYPLPEIQTPDFVTDISILTPEYLVDNYGFQVSDVMITWPDDECLVVAFAYEDTWTDLGGGSFQILREMTVIDWNSYEEGTNLGIWTFTQIINVGIDPIELICDFLPRTADVGNCESGHTLADDVEWPADLEIADYRLSPAELIEFSTVDVLDSEPSFYNSPEDYESSYQDLVVDLTSTTLTIGRFWTVIHTTFGFSWTYDQTIVVDFSEFENLITVNTGTNRAMPGVMINDAVSTNMQGITYLNTGEVSNIEYKDDFFNGINILDLILIQRHILGIEMLSENGMLAADFNSDGGIKASDIYEMRNIMTGNVPVDLVEWKFYSKEIDSQVMVQPKGAYTGIKPGDVDDSAILQGSEPIETDSKIRVDDILLNIGEIYEVPVYLQKEYNVFGIQYSTKLDLGIIDNIEITSDLSETFDYYITDDGILTFLFTSIDAIEGIGGIDSDPIFTIKFESKANSLLSLAMNHDSRYSFLANTDLELVILGGEVGDMIGTGTNSEELSRLSVYPNPTSDYLNFDLKNVSVQGSLEVSVYNLTGQKLFSKHNANQIDVSNLNAGMYYYQVKIDNYSKTGKFIMID